MTEHRAAPVTRPARVSPPPTNGMGVAGFVCSILGLVTCGVLAPIGLLLSLVGLLWRPRGLAVAGVILSLVPLVLWAVLAGVLGVGGVLAAGGFQVFASRIQAQVAAEEVRVYYSQHGQLPDQATADAMMQKHNSFTGLPPAYAPTGPSTFSLRLPGEDGAWHTPDDFHEVYDARATGTSP